MYIEILIIILLIGVQKKKKIKTDFTIYLTAIIYLFYT